MKIRGYADLNLYILSVAAFSFMFIGVITLEVHAQSVSPLEEDQDGNGDLLNEEIDIRSTCSVDFTSG